MACDACGLRRDRAGPVQHGPRGSAGGDGRRGAGSHHAGHGRPLGRLAEEALAPEGVPASEEVAAAGPAGRAQPEPVYPDGPPPAAPAPSYPVAAAEPPSTADQPQPVYPPEIEAPAPAEVAAAEAPSVETQPQPVYPPEPVSVETQPQPVYPPEPAVTAEAPGEMPRVQTEPMIVFRSVDFRETGADTGKVGLTGTGDPGARIQLFLDDTPLGEVTVGSDGNWSLETETTLATGEHTFRADRIDPETGAVIGSASLGMARMEPKPKEEEVAAQEPGLSAEPGAPSEEEMAAGEEAKPAPVAKRELERPRIYTVRRGDTLWDIAEYYYGGGWRYKAIVRANRRKIKDPHWIYPRQKFTMPSHR